jgi:hypothetical protein
VRYWATKLESHDQLIHQHATRNLEPKLYYRKLKDTITNCNCQNNFPPPALGEPRILYNTTIVLKLYKQQIDNCENLVVHPLMMILSFIDIN